MHAPTQLAALAAVICTAAAAATGPFQGFNYGSTFTTGAAKGQSDFEAEFKAAQALPGAPGGGFKSARLYTMVQGGTANDPISAIPAAISTKTSLLLGMWCSAGDAVFANELQALKAAIAQYGDSFGALVAGISVGSEDLYRISPTGLVNKENPGAGPDIISGYIKQVKDALTNTPLAGTPVGHVDTWTAWVNGSNQAVINACDFIGVDAYPYFQNTMANSIENSNGLFNDAIGATQAAVGGKPVWVTETGFPTSGKTSNLAVPSVDNAKTYWDQVGCPRFGTSNVWWYTLQDAAPDTPNPSFGIIGNSLTSAPYFDLSCKNVAPPPASSTGTGSSGSGSGTGTGTTAASGSSSSSSPKSGTTSATTGGIGAGSPGAGSGLPSSQVSLETSSVTNTSAKPTGSSGTTTGSGTGSPGSTTTSTTQNSAPTQPGSVFAALAAALLAMIAL